VFPREKKLDIKEEKIEQTILKKYDTCQSVKGTVPKCHQCQRDGSYDTFIVPGAKKYPFRI